MLLERCQFDLDGQSLYGSCQFLFVRKQIWSHYSLPSHFVQVVVRTHRIYLLGSYCNHMHDQR